MNLLFLMPGDAAPPRADLEAAGVDAILAQEALPGAEPPARPLVLTDAGSAPEAEACQAAAGTVARDAAGFVGCVHRARAFAIHEARVLEAARAPAAGVVLDGADRWYLAGPRGAGFCDACADRLDERLRRTYGEMLGPSRPLQNLAADERAPFHRELSAQRWHGGVETAARLVRRARDEARRARQVEALVGARFAACSPAAVALCRHLDFALVPVPPPAKERSRVATYEMFLAALGRRELVGLVEEDLGAPGNVAQAARLAQAAGASVALTSSATAPAREALAAHRKFWATLNGHYRPPDRLAEALLLYSPECDHWTGGRHGAGTRAAAEALTALGAQYRITTALPRSGTEPVVLADAGALPEAEAKALDWRLRAGASAIVIGGCGTVDEEGLALEGPFGSLQPGLNVSDHRTLFAIDPAGNAEGLAERRFEPLVGELDRALESLIGRGRRAAGFRGADLVVKCYLDPDRKLDVQLVGRSFDPASGAAAKVSGAVLYLSGAAASGARSGQFLTEDGQARKVTLSPFGMGVQVALPEFAGSALLTVAR